MGISIKQGLHLRLLGFLVRMVKTCGLGDKQYVFSLTHCLLCIAFVVANERRLL